MLTVYFDTNFYVDLARADEALAYAVLTELNQIEVRGVFSFDLIRELLVNADSPRRDASLVRRLRRLSRGFLALDDGTWEVLLLSGSERKRLAERILESRQSLDLAKSFALSAARPASDAEFAAMKLANQKVFEEQQILDDQGEVDPNAAISGIIAALEKIGAASEDLLARLRDAQHDLARLNDADEKGEKERLQLKIQAGLEGIMETVREIAPGVYEGKRAEEEAFSGDPRPRSVVMQRGEKDISKKLSNSYRDAGHIGRFVANRDQIDFLQVDSAQYNRLTDPNGPRPSQLSEHSLLDRVFSASLETMADKLSELASSGLSR